MKKQISIFLLLACVFAVSSVCVFGQSADKKRIIVIADFGPEEVPESFLDAVEKNQAVKVAVASSAGKSLPTAAEALLKEKRLEVALSLIHEPVFPLFYETGVSSPCAVDFPWPEDARNIIFRGQEDYRSARKHVSRGLSLRSGSFSTSVVPDMKRFGLKWASFVTTERPEGVYVHDRFFIIAARPDMWTGTEECFESLNESTGAISAMVWEGSDPLLLQFLEECSKRSDMEMMLPGELTQATEGVQEAGEMLNTGFDKYTANPLPWHRLSKLRSAVEEYKNSGFAKLKVLDSLHEGLYGLYHFDNIGKLQYDPQAEDEELFQAEIKRLYALLNKTEPDFNDVESAATEVVSSSETVAYAVECGTSAFRITNSFSGSGTVNIREFGLSLHDDAVAYDISLFEPLPSKPFRVDVYIDLNNHYGAGLTAMLQGLDGFLQSENAWEFALRIENGTASLYRSGRFAPVLVDKYKTVSPYLVKVPRRILKGNPLQWGYQVVTSYVPDSTPASGVEDFLCQDDASRQTILNKLPVQLPAVRIK